MPYFIMKQLIEDLKSQRNLCEIAIVVCDEVGKRLEERHVHTIIEAIHIASQEAVEKHCVEG